MKTLLFDFSRVLLFPVNESYSGSLNALYKEKMYTPGFDFFDYFKLNTELLDYLNIQKRLYSLNIFTSESIQDAPELKLAINPLFDRVFSAIDIGFSKKDPRAYGQIGDYLELVTNQITFIDDSLENIEAAEESGMNTIVYRSNSELFALLNLN